MNQYGCLDHMRRTGHRQMMEPMYVAGYLCPQCLMLFSAKDQCSGHMDAEAHFRYQYPFKGKTRSHKSAK